MNRGYFTNLPSEITTNILSRLSARTVAISKCVCKPWLHFLETDDFLKSHLSKSVPALVVSMPVKGESNWCKVFELEGELDLGSHSPLTAFDFPYGATVQGSANGLLFLHDLDKFVCVCNPITREFYELLPRPLGGAYGFGASKITGQHKVVCMNPQSRIDPTNPNCLCHVYTLGTGSWRHVEAPASFDISFSTCLCYCFDCCIFGTLVNGNLHWIVSTFASFNTEWICCFDIENECCSTFALPLPSGRCLGNNKRRRLVNLRDCLCFCDESSPAGDEIGIWMIKEYEVDKSWSKEYVINLNPYYGADDFNVVFPIKVFNNGDILMMCAGKMFIYYSNKTKTAQEIGWFGAQDGYKTSMLLTPSFLSLKSLGMEDVISF